MQKDKKLQSLLSTYSMQEPSAEFDDKVMQRVATLRRTQNTSLLSSLIKRLLLVIFITVAVTLFITTLFIQPKIFIPQISIPLSYNIYTELFSFFAAFWIVMFINLWWNKRNTPEV